MIKFITVVLSLSLLLGASLSDRPSSESGGGWNPGSSGGNWNSRPDSNLGGHFNGGGNSGGHFNPGHNAGRPEAGSGGHHGGGHGSGGHFNDGNHGSGGHFSRNGANSPGLQHLALIVGIVFTFNRF